MKFKELIFSSKHIIHLYVATFIVSEIIFCIVQLKSNLFSDQYYLMMVADNYAIFYLSIILFSSFVLGHNVLSRKDNISLLSNHVYILMLPYIFVFAFYLNGWISICFGMAEFHNTFMALFYYGFFMVSYLVLIIANTLIGRLSMSRRGLEIEYNG